MSMLKITARDAATGPVLEVSGDLDYRNATRLRERVTATVLRPGQRLILDLSGLEFCDSSGISALIAAHHHATTLGANVALAAVPAPTLRILRLIGLDTIIPLHPDSDPAALA
ncbi:STAS domain-containing protein [Streptomyces buecherae]|uniref:Anti-sigma factor antagonist n=1 Tax=Streptomyces buecherae TaxID=2763006 RepID=A0A7H8N3N1_9ACTN|nr:STAS domain-containing protein [Streptomyces buecherae]QKW49134.1 STAS domain-containing protein [Streptomyces buecherae]